MARLKLVCAALACLMVFAACETDTPTEKERTEVTQVVHTFLVKLAEAYGNTDITPLEGIAAPRFMARARHDIDLLKAGGDRLEPSLLSLDITDMKIIRHANAYVAATEVWDTKRFDAVTGQLVGHDAHSVLHSHIQLKLIDHKWMVLVRDVDETATGPRLIVPTPTPR
jgi:hypothetical protein